MTLQKLGGLAALLNPLAGLAMLVIAVVVIGPASADPVRLAEIAIHDPLPLLLQDGLKLVSAALAALMILAVAARLGRGQRVLTGVASVFGFASVACLAANAGLSLYATSQAAVFAATSPEAGIALSGVIAIVATAVIILNGFWVLLTGLAGLRSKRLPAGLCILSLFLGTISLIPPLAVAVLIVSLGWSIWLGRTLLTPDPTG